MYFYIVKRVFKHFKKNQYMQQFWIVLLGIVLWNNTTQAQDFKIEAGQLILPVPISFEVGSDKIKSESEVSLHYIKQFLEAKPAISLIRIEGHVDAGGNTAFNQALTEKRAMAVLQWLVAKGMDCKRLLAVGFGDSKPIAPNNTTEGKMQNRRIDIKIASLRGRAVGGTSLDGGGRVAGESCPKG